ncbi:MAG: flavodoxin domain-containing protein [Campylobacterota bacterium]
MAKIGIFYASAGGNTTQIAQALTQTFDVADEDCIFMEEDFDDIEQFEDYDVLFIGSSTWGQGDPHFEWVDPLLELEEQAPDFSGKKVAFFGAGDSDKHGEHFCSALGKLYSAFVKLHATPIGAVSKSGYSYESSLAQIGDKLCGLCIDNMNEEDKTPQRIESWCKQLESEV